VAELGPLVARKLEADYTGRAASLVEVKLEDHVTPAATSLRLALARADASAREGVWVEAVRARDEAIGLLPDARKEIAVHLSGVAKDAIARGESELALYFYERVLRLEPASTDAKAYLFANKFKAGELLRAPDGMTLAYVPPGEFMRGSRATEPGRGSDEVSGRVRLTEGFFLGVTEVTQRQWDRVMGEGDAARIFKAARAPLGSIGPDLPMHHVSWDEARDFCVRLTEREGRVHRLPTEAEWEYACRAGTSAAFNFGAEGLSAREANIDDGSADARSGPVAVGSLGVPNAWGLRDMHGNVWEWCADWSAPYPAGDATDPRGPADAVIGPLDLALRVVRGGGWNASASDARSANRWAYTPAVGTGYIGLRVAREPDLVSK
jgi:formylglycine-generating enzyme required for sulfatase activity